MTICAYSKKRDRCRRMARFEKPKADSRRVAKNTAVLYLRILAVMAIGLFTGRVIFNALGVTDYGLQNVASSVIGIVTFLMGSLSMASARFLVVEMGRGTPGSLKRMFSTLFYVHLILACLFVILLETVGLIFLETKLNIDPSRIFAVKWTYHCAVFSTFIGMTQVPYSAAINGHERMNAFAWMTIYDVVVKLIIALAIQHYGGDRLILLSTLNAVVCLTTQMIYRFYCIRNFSEARVRRVFNIRMMKPILSFAGTHIATQTVTMLMTQGVLAINQRYFGPTLVAAISVGTVLTAHIDHFIGNFKAAANPQIIKLYSAKKFAEAKRMLTDTHLFSVFLFLLLGIPAWFYADEALTIWLGPSRPELSPLIARIILVGAFFFLFTTSLYIILYAAGRIKENMYVNVVAGLVSFALVIYLVRWRHNAIASVCVASGWKLLSGMLFKPFLVHYVANYSLKDYRPMFVLSFEALFICAAIGFGVRTLMPSGLGWAIPACTLIVLINAIAMYFLIVPTVMQMQLCRALSKVPRFGESATRFLSTGTRFSMAFRVPFQKAAGL